VVPNGVLGGFQAGLGLGMVSTASIGPANPMMTADVLTRSPTLIAPSLVWLIYGAFIAASFKFAEFAKRIGLNFLLFERHSGPINE
jgi:hypothetical protein